MLKPDRFSCSQKSSLSGTHLYLSMLELYFLTYLSIFFSIYQDEYVNVNSLYIKFLYNIFLPDVASDSIAAFTFVSLVLSVPLTLVEDDEANKV